MIKKINVKQLKPGMFVHDFNCGWLNHPFLTDSILVDNERIIEKVLKHGIQELYIDTDKGADVANAPTEEEVRREIQTEITRVVEQEKTNIHPVPIQEELIRAGEIKKEAKRNIQSLMEDVRLGKQIQVEKTEHVVDEMIDSIFRNQDALVSLARIREKDEYTYMHSVSVGVLMIAFGRHLGCDVPLLRELGVGGMLHDIGKMIVSQVILTKEEKLTEKELELMKKHVEYSRILLEQTHGITETAVILAAQHHERVDGTGYPLGLKGDEIAYYSRAVAIADVYDAMTSQRCYQNRYQPTDALRKLYEWSNYHFDRDLMQQFIRCVGIYPVGTLVRLGSGLVGVIIKHGETSLLHPVIRIVYDSRKEKHIRVPYDLDLSLPAGKGGEDRIVSYESPDKWGLRPEMYL
ncbi:MAG: HD-GYP domain-containing protein [Nitrospiraceae bacterium]|nr:MAG: HD-GYP domain-containing protein [Nitrospiraceae bacterium]